MNTKNRKKAARIQGGWAVSATANVRSDKEKPKMPVTPAWLGKNVDNPSQNDKKYVYEQPPEEEMLQKSPDIIIKKQGIHDLSLEPSGVSRIRYFPHFLDKIESDALFTELFHECPWHQRSDIKNGVNYLQPRLTTWFGDLPYTYSGQTLEPNTRWLPCLVTLKDHLQDVTGLHFNSMLANLYRDNHDRMDWHSDDEPSLQKNPTIASLSLGDSRNFELRKKPSGHANDFTFSQIVRLMLDAGSLIIMEGSLQDDWQHRVPNEYHDRGPRINLTFRVIYPES